MEVVVPYPRPDYTDPELDSKEMINGSFIPALFDDIRNFRPAFDRYNVTENKLVDMSAMKEGKVSPERFDITMRDPGLGGLKEMAWLPLTREDQKKEPEVIYDPLKYYTYVEYVPLKVEDIPLDPLESIVIDIPYYDRNNPGLFGFQTLKDDDGNVTERNAYFYSLKDHSLSFIATIPLGLDFESMTYLGYLKGALLLHFEPDTLVTLPVDGGYYAAYGYQGRVLTFGEYGQFAATDGSRSYVFNVKFEKQNIVTVNEKGEIVVKDYIDGDYCSGGVSQISAFSACPFGTLVNNKFYFAKSETESYKWWLTKYGWHAAYIGKDVWKYNKMLKYDYATDNWMNTPLKTMHYNLRERGVFVANHLPCKDRTCEFKSSDPYGDFTAVGDELYHTFDFKKWERVDGEAHSRFYGMWERIWVKDGDDGIVGYMPYTFSIVDVDDLNTGEKKMISRFEGFVFRE